MDHAVALVETYLRVNGYFTVTEYPVVEATRSSGYRTATDVDVLAFRFPDSHRVVPRAGAGTGKVPRAEEFSSDPELGGAGEQGDMIIGEVKEGRAELNQAATDPAVLQAVMTRFGCCDARHAPVVVQELLRNGRAQTHCRHQVRLVAFGSQIVRTGKRKYKVMSLDHVLRFLRDHIHEHWAVLSNAQFKDPIFGFLVMQEKASRGVKLT